ncbi:unnamed protein product [Chrysoparadoxa australica]
MQTTCELDSMTLAWTGLPECTYRLEMLPITEKDWAQARIIAPQLPREGQEYHCLVDGLQGSMSYLCKLVQVGAGGEEQPSSPIAFDTQVVTCAPDGRRCAIA